MSVNCRRKTRFLLNRLIGMVRATPVETPGGNVQLVASATFRFPISFK